VRSFAHPFVDIVVKFSTMTATKCGVAEAQEAKGTRGGKARGRVTQLARQAEMGGRISEWLGSPGLQPPE